MYFISLKCSIFDVVINKQSEIKFKTTKIISFKTLVCVYIDMTQHFLFMINRRQTSIRVI